MSNTETSPAPAPKRKGKKLVWILIILFLLVVTAPVALYLAATSAVVIKGLILPKTGGMIGAEITVQDISLSAFSGARIEGLKFRNLEDETLLEAERIEASFSAPDFAGGEIKVKDILVRKPVITLKQQPDGSTTLDPVLESIQDLLGEPAPADPNAPPPNLQISNIAIEDGTLIFIKQSTNGTVTSKVEGLNVKIDQVVNGKPLKVDLALKALLESALQGAPTDRLEATLKSQVEVGLTDALMPGGVQLSGRLDVPSAAGTLAPVQGLGADLKGDLSLEAIKEFSVNFAQAGQSLGSVSLSGPFNMDTMAADLSLKVSQLDQRVLNLAGAAAGVRFENTSVNVDQNIKVAANLSQVDIRGGLQVDKLNAIQGEMRVPEMDLKVENAVSVTFDDQQAPSKITLEKLSVQALRQSKAFLETSLAQPMVLNLGGAEQLPASTLLIKVIDFNLQDWASLLPPDTVSSGLANAEVRLTAENGGEKLTIQTTAGLTGLATPLLPVQNQNLGTSLKADIQVSKFNQVDIPSYTAILTQAGRELAQASGKVGVTLSDMAVQTAVNATLQLANLVNLLGIPDVQFQGGTLGVSLQASMQGTNRLAAAGRTQLAGLTGSAASVQLNNLGLNLDFDTAITGGNQLNIRKFAGQLEHAGGAAGTLDIAGTLNLTTTTGKLNVNLKDVNERLLAAILQPALGDQKLASGNINLTANLDATSDQAGVLKANFSLANLNVQDKSGKGLPEPLQVGLTTRTDYSPTTVKLSDTVLSLKPTSMAENRLTVQGNVDFANTNAIRGRIDIASTALDLTDYYKTFGQGSATEASPNGQPAPAPAPAPADPNAGGEAAPIITPFSNFLVNLDVKRLYLDKLALTKVITKVQLNGGKVDIDPVSMVFNGAPLSSAVNLDLGVPGYTYKVAFNTKDLPVLPLAQTFAPDLPTPPNGILNATVGISGAGTTGDNLRKHLTGDIDVVLTNANIRVDNMPFYVKAPMTLVLTVLRLNDLTSTPITSAVVDTSIQSGTVHLDKIFASSAAFNAGTMGKIDIAPVLTNSVLNLPVILELRPDLAAKFGSGSSDADTNKFIRLPKFASVEGTLGNNEVKTDKAVIAGLTAKTLLNAPLGIGQDLGKGVGKGVGNILGGIGNVLTGEGMKKDATTNSTEKAEPSDAQKIVQGIEGLGGLFKKKK